MLCTVTSFFKKQQNESALPYFTIKAEGLEGDANANAINEDGTVNVMACQSRRYRFTKNLFPATPAQVEALEKAFNTDNEGNIIGDAPKIHLISAVWASPFDFAIKKSDSLSGYYETIEYGEETTKVVNGKVVKTTPFTAEVKVFKTVNVTLFANADGTCAEGDPETLCKAMFERMVGLGNYVPAETLETTTVTGEM